MLILLPMLLLAQYIGKQSDKKHLAYNLFIYRATHRCHASRYETSL